MMARRESDKIKGDYFVSLLILILFLLHSRFCDRFLTFRWWNCNMIFLHFFLLFHLTLIKPRAEGGMTRTRRESFTANPFPRLYNWWLQRLENPVRLFPSDNLLAGRCDKKGNSICWLRILTISDVSLINYRSQFVPKNDTWRNSKKNFFRENIFAAEKKSSVVVSLFTFSINFFLLLSVYDDIIKLTIEHLTFTLVHWEFSWCSLANRKINIHSCIQRTWLLLCEFYTFFLLFFRWIQEGGKENYFSSAIPKFLRFFSWLYRFMFVIYIQPKQFSLWVVVSNLNGLVK